MPGEQGCGLYFCVIEIAFLFLITVVGFFDLSFDN